MQRNRRKECPDVWQFRWSETRLDGKRLYHKKIVGTVEQYPDEDAARRSVVGLVTQSGDKVWEICGEDSNPVNLLFPRYSDAFASEPH